ncbi:hypothetical protein ADL22_12310 [Streptomyces sp. NRRL F-4489]|uniref:hypothetical protein n=1 Tax=Streptomyces sp. NRRL F-4489 TaxID=1609095 RepID=UPI000749C1E0|nr:hypothetical protein [Streptomyces sp. NRRL F-4489]KUL44720.1 hypothetical protein ADL22_12310 [Streptomyces sp. NRRL F-4489]
MEFSDAPLASYVSANTPESDFQRKAARWAMIRDRVAAQQMLLDSLKQEMIEDLREFGVRDEKGSYALDLGRSYEVGGKSFTGLKYQRSVTREVDEDAASRIGKEKSVYDRLFPPRPVFDAQEVYVLFQEGLLTEEEVDQVFPEKTVWSFVRVGGK